MRRPRARRQVGGFVLDDPPVRSRLAHELGADEGTASAGDSPSLPPAPGLP